MSEKLNKNTNAEIGIILILPILVIISLFVVVILGNAVIPSSITTASNLSASTATGGNGTAGNPYTGGYNSWNTQTQTTVSTVPTLIGINYLFVYPVILLTMVGIIAKVAS